MKKRAGNSKLLSTTKELMRTREAHLTYAAIAEKTGLRLQFLYDLMADRLNDPGVIKIERLYNYLANKELLKEAA